LVKNAEAFNVGFLKTALKKYLSNTVFKNHRCLYIISHFILRGKRETSSIFSP